jgi:sugar phosphate isomerase/epimerase
MFSAFPFQNLNKLCVHTQTTKSWNLEVAAEKYAKSGVKGITVWRDALNGRNPTQAGARIRDQGLSIVSLCEEGFLAGYYASERRNAIDHHRRAIAEAHALGAPLIVLVCGAVVGQKLSESRKQVQEGIAAILPDCIAAGVKVAIEPLHPMYADTHSVINTLGHANDLCDAIGSPFVGVAIDVYHLWWDPTLEAEIARCGRQRKLFAYHVSDWRTPTVDMRNDRGLMGEGCIPLRHIRAWVESAGFCGFNEVEISSNRLWATNQEDYLKHIVRSYSEFV